MLVIVNGNVTELDCPITLQELLHELGFADKPVVVERNKHAIFSRDYNDIFIEDRDQLEIISIAAGG